MRPKPALEYGAAAPNELPPLNRVFLVREQNDRSQEGCGPYLPKIIFDDLQLAIDFVVSRLKWPVDKPLPEPNASGGYHFDDGFSIDAMPVVSQAHMDNRDMLAQELERVQGEQRELAAHAAALEVIVSK